MISARFVISLLFVPFVFAALPAKAVAQDATVTVIHGIPGDDLDLDPELPVDINVVGVACALTDFRFGDISDRLALPAGEYDLEVRLSTGDCTGDVAVSKNDVPVGSGENITFIAHLSEVGAPALMKYVNDVSPTPERDGRLAVHHTAKAPAVDIEAFQFDEGRFIPQVLLEEVTNPQSAAAAVPADFYSVSIAPAGGSAVALESLAVGEGELALVYAVGSLDKGTFTLIVDKQEVGTSGPLAKVTVMHGLPGADLGLDPHLPVDVHVVGVTCLLTDFRFTEISPRVDLPAGEYDIEIRISDGNCTGDVAIEAKVPFAAGENATVIAHLAADGSPTASKFTNDVSEGKGRLALHHTAATGAVDIDVFKPYYWWVKKVFSLDGVRNGQAASEDVKPKKYYVSVRKSRNGSLLGWERARVYENTALFLYAVGTPGTHTFRFLADSQPID